MFKEQKPYIYKMSIHSRDIIRITPNVPNMNNRKYQINILTKIISSKQKVLIN
jgi:hypothetical protein